MENCLVTLGGFVDFIFFSKKVFIQQIPIIVMEITTDFLVQVSINVLIFAIVVIIGSLVYLFFSNKKTEEEKKALSIFKKIEQLKKAKHSHKTETHSIESTSKEMDFDKTQSSLKTLLVKKFKPKIESQLGSKINIIEFDSSNNKLTALIEISDVRILLSLDSSGKIIDYKKVKAN